MAQVRCVRVLILTAVWLGVLAGTVPAHEEAALQSHSSDATGDPVISARLGAVLEDTAGGAVVRVLIPGSGASKAGLRIGDVLVECSDEPVRNAEEVDRVLRAIPGSEARLGALREGRRVKVTAVLDLINVSDFLAPYSRRPTREGPYLRYLPRGGVERIGVVVLDLTRQLADHFETGSGVLITEVRQWSPADRAGLRAGDVVTGINQSPVRTAAAFSRELHRDLSGARLSFTVMRGRRQFLVDLEVIQ